MKSEKPVKVMITQPTLTLSLFWTCCVRDDIIAKKTGKLFGVWAAASDFIESGSCDEGRYTAPRSGLPLALFRLNEGVSSLVSARPLPRPIIHSSCWRKVPAALLRRDRGFVGQW